MHPPDPQPTFPSATAEPSNPTVTTDSECESAESNGEDEEIAMPDAGPSTAKPTRSQRRRMGRNKKRAFTDPDGLELSMAHVENSIPWQAHGFEAPAAPHAADGFIGQKGGAMDYTFLKGTYTEQVKQLQEREYDFLDPPPE